MGVYWLPAAASVGPNATVSCAVVHAVELVADAEVLALDVSLALVEGAGLEVVAEAAGLLEPADAEVPVLPPPLHPASSTTSAAVEVSIGRARRTVTR
jgi:hypothetical protein